MKHSIKLGLHVKPLEPTEEVAIRLRVSWSGCRTDLRSGFFVDPAKWDSANENVKANTKNKAGQSAGEINRALSRLCTKAEDVLLSLEKENGRVPDAKEFKAAFDLAIGRAKSKPSNTKFSRAFNLFTTEMGRQHGWTDSTYKKFNSLKMHLNSWRKEIDLDNFTKEDFDAFVLFLQKEKKLLNTTVSKQVGFLRWFLRWAAGSGYYNGLAHQQYRPRFRGLDCKEVIYLEWEELLSFLNFDFSNSNFTSYAPVRDVFCFCCFTGLRYSDVAKLRRSDLYLTSSPPYMVVVTKKTTDRLHIELNKYALSILKKYENVQFPRGLALPVISNVKMNEHLHEAAKAAGIDEPVRLVQFRSNERIEKVVPKYALLTTHCGRRTFIVNGLRLGIPAPVIMEWTGHSDYKAMKPYIKIVDAAKAENMAKFDDYGKSKKNGKKSSTRKSTRK